MPRGKKAPKPPVVPEPIATNGYVSPLHLTPKGSKLICPCGKPMESKWNGMLCKNGHWSTVG